MYQELYYKLLDDVIKLKVALKEIEKETFDGMPTYAATIAKEILSEISWIKNEHRY